MHEDRPSDLIGGMQEESQLAQSAERLRIRLKVLTRDEILLLLGDLFGCDLTEQEKRNALRDEIRWLGKMYARREETQKILHWASEFEETLGEIKKQLRNWLVAAALASAAAYAASHWK